MLNRVYYATKPLARAHRNLCPPQPVAGARKITIISTVIFAIMLGLLFHTFAGPAGQLGNLSLG